MHHTKLLVINETAFYCPLAHNTHIVVCFPHFHVTILTTDVVPNKDMYGTISVKN